MDAEIMRKGHVNQTTQACLQTLVEIYLVSVPAKYSDSYASDSRIRLPGKTAPGIHI